MTAPRMETEDVWLPQYRVPALAARAFLRARGKRPGIYVRSAERVAAIERVDATTLLEAGRLAAIVWSIVSFACVAATILSAIFIGRRLAPDSWLDDVVSNIFPGLLAIGVSCIGVINVRLRAAERSQARGDAVPPPLAIPKRRDLAIVLIVAALLLALANAATSGSA